MECMYQGFGSEETAETTCVRGGLDCPVPEAAVPAGSYRPMHRAQLSLAAKMVMPL